MVFRRAAVRALCCFLAACSVLQALAQDARQAHRFQAILDLPSQVTFAPPPLPVDPSGPNPDDPNVAAIEFNEQGLLWHSCTAETSFASSRCQVNYAVELIQMARRDLPPDTKLIVLTFIHGWRHNSLWDDANFTNFREAIDCFNWGEKAYATAYADVLKAPPPKDWQHLQCKGIAAPEGVRYLGVYIGWQGTTPDLRDDIATLKTRYAVAKLTAQQPDMEDVFKRLRAAAKKPTFTSQKPARLIFMGHSFGALILERTADKLLDTKQLADTAACAADANTTGARKWTELFLLVNSANTAATGVGLVDRFHHATFCKSSDTNTALSEPWIVSIHSDSDIFTGKVGTVGRKILGLEPPYAGPAIGKTSGSIASPKDGLLKSSTFNNDTFFLSSCYIDSSMVAKHSKTGDLLCDRIAQQVARRKDAVVPGQGERGAYDLVTEPCGPTPLRPDAPTCTGPLLVERNRRWSAMAAGLSPYLSMPDTKTAGEPDHLLNLYYRDDIGCSRKDWSGDQPPCLAKKKDQPLPAPQPPFNTTPYWAFNVPDDVIAGHDGFWTDRLSDIINSLLVHVEDVP